MGDIGAMKGWFCVVAFAMALAAQHAFALPLQGETTGLLQETAGLFPKTDDAATLTSEVDEQIQQQVNMADVGESPDVGNNANYWEKKAAADINSMSKSEIASVHSTYQDDHLTQQFDEDTKEAAAAMAKPKKQKDTKFEIEKEAETALKDPAKAKALEADAQKAEIDLESTFPSPVAFLQEDFADMDSDDEAGLQLMDGSDDDVAKAINARISQQVNQQLGSVADANEQSGQQLKQFEEDKMEASKFLAAKRLRQKNKIQQQLAEAQKAMAAAQEESQEGNEEKKK